LNAKTRKFTRYLHDNFNPYQQKAELAFTKKSMQSLGKSILTAYFCGRVLPVLRQKYHKQQIINKKKQNKMIMN